MGRRIKRLILVGLVAFVGMQFVGPARTNPAVEPDKAITKHVAVPADVKALLDRSGEGSREAPGHGAALRLAAVPPLGHVEGRPPLAPVRRTGRGRHRRAGRCDEGHGRRRTLQALRRRGRVHLHARQPRGRLHGARRRPRGGLVDQPGRLGGAARWQPEAAQPHRRQQGRRHRTGVLARRPDAGVSLDGAGRLRSRQAAHHAGRLARPERAAPRPRRDVGSIFVSRAITAAALSAGALSPSSSKTRVT